MSWSSSIRIKFYSVQPVSAVFSVLHRAGWGFGNDLILYEHYVNDDDFACNVQYAPASALSEVLALLDTKSQAGEQIRLRLDWQGDDVMLDCNMKTSEELVIYFGADAPALCEPYSLTDFSWMLHRIAVPLLEAGYDTAEVECSSGH